MFVRFKKNKSGSTSVMLVMGERIPGKKHSLLRIIKTFGSSTDPDIIEKLHKQANSYKLKLEQESPKSKTLRVTSHSDLRSCNSYNRGFNDVYGKFFDNIFGNLKLKEHDHKRLKSLVTMRIAHPCSKLKTSQISEDFGIDLKVDNIYKTMDKLNKPTIEEIKKIIFLHSKDLLSTINETVDVLFYDLTTLYFETNTQDEVRDFGFSKDGKSQHVQIVLALVVTKEGLPISYEYFAGNTYEGHTLIPVLNKLKESYNINRVVLVADAALMSRINIRELSNQGYQYIISARLKNSIKSIKDEILNFEGYEVISETKDNAGESLDITSSKAIDTKEGDMIIAYHSTSRARKDRHERLKDLEKIAGCISSSGKGKLSGNLKKSYVKVRKDCELEINDEKLELDEKFDGIFGIRTNVQEMNPAEILGQYRGLWQIEQSFRIAKNNLEIRPVYHYNIKSIEAHLAICYISLAVMRYVEFRLKRFGNYISNERLHILLTKMREVKIIDHEGNEFKILEDPPSDLVSIYQILEIKWPKKFKSS